MDFNIIVYGKFIDIVSDSALQVAFKKLLWLSNRVISKKNINNYL